MVQYTSTEHIVPRSFSAGPREMSRGWLGPLASAVLDAPIKGITRNLVGGILTPRRVVFSDPRHNPFSTSKKAVGITPPLPAMIYEQ